MKALIVLSTSVLLSFTAGCSSNPSTSSNSTPLSVTMDQVEQKRVVLFYEKGSDTPYTGAVVDYYPSGETKASMHFEQGLPVGKAVRWYRSGQKSGEAKLSGNKSGRTTEWYENGQLKSEGELVNGRVNGLMTTWHPNGQKKSEENQYVEGRPVDGTATTWYENGQMKSEELWVSGQTRCSAEWDQAGNKQHQFGSGCGGTGEQGDPTATIEQASVGVLPFVNMSANPDSELLSDSMTESVIRELDSRGLNVAPRDQSFGFKGVNMDLHEIAQQLGVSHILEGSVRTSGDSVRVTAQLIRASDDYFIWSETYDRQVADLRSIQIEIGDQIADALTAN